ncbi:MAG TPA: hypothetical protein VM425_01740 [Myxococcota bacterium]|nr:hypothetical protein [Myxococcota bacterium]
MRCPNCGKEVPDGTAICEHCDHILDKSFLGGGFTDDSAGESGGNYDQDGSSGSDDQASPGGDQVDREMEALRRRRRVEKNPPRGASGIEESKDLGEEAGKLVKDVKGTFSNAWGFYKKQDTSDKLCTAGAAFVVLFVFFPWVTISGASSITKIGIEVGGWFSMLMGAAMIALIYMRGQKHWRDKQKVVIYAQAGVAGLTLISLLIQMGKLSSLTAADTDSPLEMTLGTHIQIGLVFSMLGAIAMAAGAGLLLKEKVLAKKG